MKLDDDRDPRGGEASTPLSILYADDDADIRTIVTLALSLDRGIALSVAASGAEALALLAHGAVPDVALFDVMMPGLNGPAVMDVLRRDPETAGMPVIFITARAREADIAGYRDKGAIGVILKPFDPLQLAAQIRALLAAHRSWH